MVAAHEPLFVAAPIFGVESCTQEIGEVRRTCADPDGLPIDHGDRIGPTEE